MSRVLMVNYEFPPIGGGGGVAAKTIAKGLVRGGYEVDYVTSRYSGQPKTERVDGITIHRVRVGRRNKRTATVPSLLAYPVAGFPRCARLCLLNDYEFVNTHFAVPSGPLGVAVAKTFDLDHVLSIHGGDIHDPTKEFSPHNWRVLKKAVSWVLGSADRVVAQSNDTKANALRYYDVDDEQHIKVIPLPYEPYEFEPVPRSELGLAEDKRYAVSVGRLVERKGYRDFVEAISMLDENVEALVIGEGPRREQLEAYTEKLGIEERVHLLGYVEEERKFQYLNRADVYVLSSLHEGFGIVLQEAMQVELPIVATDYGGQTDLVEDGENGFVVPRRNPEELADGIRRALGTEFSYEGGEYLIEEYSSKLRPSGSPNQD